MGELWFSLQDRYLESVRRFGLLPDDDEYMSAGFWDGDI